MKKLITLILLFTCCFSAFAGQFTASLENDVFIRSGGKNSDDDYSNGARFEYLFDNKFGIAFGQSMYTPPDITIEEDQPGYREYAGYAYLEGSYRRTPTEFGAIQLGFIGKNSLAEQTQKTIHDWIGSREPKGWDNQIEGHGMEAQAYYKYMYRLIESDWFYLCPSITASAGSVNVIGTPGIFAYFTFNYTPTYDGLIVTEIRGTDPGFGSWIPLAYLFAGAECDMVAYNYFLDASESTVDKEYFVGEFSTGIGLQIKRFIGKFAYIFRTKEYEEQETLAHFGAITLGWVF